MDTPADPYETPYRSFAKGKGAEGHVPEAVTSLPAPKRQRGLCNPARCTPEGRPRV